LIKPQTTFKECTCIYINLRTKFIGYSTDSPLLSMLFIAANDMYKFVYGSVN